MSRDVAASPAVPGEAGGTMVRLKVVLTSLFLTAIPGFISSAGAQGEPAAAPHAGPHGSPGDRVQTQVGALKARLGLSDEQATKLQAILSESAREAQADRAAGGTPDRTKARERMRRSDEQI